ncbi:metal-sulfur cluster assembly factor [Streptomyces sp. BH104]|uniref:metal-sulfur cluster assembly factor n=1 Tax=Streptomyces sp. BH104 TaxID=3410407 RepID=UPI003BB6925C
MTVTEARVRAVLNEIVDPCSITAGVPAGLDDMGLVSEIRVEEDFGGADSGGGASGARGWRVAATVGVTEPSCVLIGSFASEAQARLAALPGVTAVDISLADDYEWTQDRLAPAYRRRLEEHRARKRRTLPLLIASGTAGAAGHADEY